jgi:fibronectin type 3 domain-containing protein
MYRLYKAFILLEVRMKKMQKICLLRIVVCAVVFAACTLPVHTVNTPQKIVAPAPVGIQAVAASSASIAVSWQPVAGAVNYAVYRALAANGTFIRIGTTAQPPYSDTGLEQDVMYYYKVSTVMNNSGEGPQSAAISAKITPLLPPALVTATPLSLTSISVSWEPVAEADGYLMYRSSTGEAGPYVKLTVATITINTYTDTSASPSTEYYYKVSVINFIGESVQSAYVRAATLPPAAPENVAARVLSANSIAVSWQPVSGATSYKVYRSAASSGPYNALTTAGIVTAAYTDTTVSGAAEYYYKISAINVLGEGAQSDYAYASTMPPAAPLGLTALPLSDSSIAISWNPTGGATGYKLYRAANIAGPYDLTATVIECSFSDSNLTSATAYYYKVSAVNGIGEGAQSAAVSGATLLSAPAGLAAVVQSNSSVTISWDNLDSATSYRLYHAASEDREFALIASPSGTSYTHTGLTVSTPYYYKVSGVSPQGEGVLSDFITVSIALPSAPSGITAAVLSADSIQISWDAVPGAASYKVYHALSNGDTYTAVGTVTGTSFTHTGLSTAATYYYKVSAVHAVGEGPQSEAVSATILIPATPTGFAVVVLSQNSVRLSWNTVSNATGYKVYRAPGGSDDFAAITMTAGLTHTDTGLQVDTEYRYKVAATNANGEGVSSAIITVRLALPDTVTALTALPQSATSLRLSWAAVPGAVSYKVYYALSNGGTYTAVGTVTGTSFTHTGLTTATTYYYKVAAVNAVGEGPQSEALSTIIALPATPTGLTVTPLSHTSLRISWNAVPGAALYSVYQAGYDSVTAFNIITSVTGTSYTNTGLDPFCQYYYKVAAVNDIGTGALSATAVSTYTQPIPLSDGVWYSSTTSYSGYDDYYSFPVTGGSYYIQWGNVGHTGEATGYYFNVSAYWKSDNSMTNLSTRYFVDQTNGLANPRVINAPSSGYIIVRVSNYYSSNNYDVRFYRE